MESAKTLSIEKQVENIAEFKKLLDEDPTNDYFLYPFMSMALNLTDKIGFLTEIGFKTLFNEINLDFDIINRNPKKPCQESLTRLALYFTICYNITLYFGGFIIGLETEEGKKFGEKLPIELIEYLKTIMVRADKLFPILEAQLKGITSKLTNEYAKIYNEEKRKAWSKDIFQTSVHIPAHKDDYPVGFNPTNCFQRD